MSNVAEIEAVLFKQFGGGYVFQAPNPWVFGRSSRYLVNDAQKAELLAIIAPRRPILRIAMITIGILLCAGAAAPLFGLSQVMTRQGRATRLQLSR